MVMALWIRSSARLGKLKEWILPLVNINLFNRVLVDFAQHFGLGKNKRIIKVLDRTLWHIRYQVEVPEGIHLFFLPPYSPELQPAERLWTLVDEPLVNEYFETIDEMEEVLIKRCNVLSKMKEEIRNITNYHWLNFL